MNYRICVVALGLLSVGGIVFSCGPKSDCDTDADCPQGTRCEQHHCFIVDAGPVTDAGGGSCADTCPTGCCADGTCVPEPDLTQCGTDGGACVACDPVRADTCTVGECRCGANAACAQGQRCVDGACTCDAESCAEGCCDGTTCRVGEAEACGINGGGCSTCDPFTANACVNGTCGCGGGAACGSGQRCAGSACVCDATSCPGGCCAGDTCNPPTQATCGLAGQTCAACDTFVSDACVNGECRCGNDAACGTGKRCFNGACVCDPVSCPNGCCGKGAVCWPGTDNTACGRNGGFCFNCTMIGFGGLCDAGSCN